MKKLLIGLSLLIVTFFTPISPIFASTYGVQTKTSQCVANVALPDSACTPGAVYTTNTKVICVVGYTKTVRNVSTATKKKVFQEYGIPWSKRSNYEVDHLISLEIGGSNDISNLFPESYVIKNGARVKDSFENYLHKQVCKGSMTIQEAQHEIATDWLQYDQIRLNPKADTVTQPVITAPVSITPKEAVSSPSTSPESVTSTSGHIWYTSSYSTSKYYYCDTDAEWKGLTAKYLQTFTSQEALLAKYKRVLHKACTL